MHYIQCIHTMREKKKKFRVGPKNSVGRGTQNKELILGGLIMFTFRRQSKAIETRCVFLVHHTSCVCCTHPRKCRTLLTFNVASHQSFAGSFPSHRPIAVCYYQFSFSFFLLVGGRIVFYEIVDGFLASGRVFHQLLDGQLVNELVRCFVGVLRPPFLSLCVPGC